MSRRRRRAGRGGDGSRTPLALGLGVLVLVVVGAAFGLTLLDPGTERARRRADGPVTEVTSSTLPTTTTVPPQAVSYVVRAGDSISAIARRFGVSTAAILLANELVDPNRLTIGATLVVPPVQLTATPTAIEAGRSVRIVIRGASPSESVSFEIVAPDGSFTGPPHRASTEGRASASYAPAVDDPPGIYTVVAHGSEGTAARATFVVAPPAP